ncbi:ribonuclease H-like protein [Annulohypoxylon maeteangense]|uniref:ribonuclease H-like protein n=1 Tax=Annulohypoxylon maeteangense TaxID=1927788 RepID=UPI002007ABFB|nr:ribonuclease H-like protein [Annulohypoxylon maeteangense]KAI0887594.1 ribonuclease H-like protein [Annulohypoxylon maeteangense]
MTTTYRRVDEWCKWCWASPSPNNDDLVDKLGNILHRLFNPDLTPIYKHVPSHYLVLYNSNKQVSQLQYIDQTYNEYRLNASSLVVYIDGTCRSSGTAFAQGAWGVFFGDKSRWNRGGLLRDLLPQTSVRAELEALSQALDVVDEIRVSHPELTQVRIASDCMYLVNAIAIWIWEWKPRGGVMTSRRKARHYGHICGIHDRLERMWSVGCMDRGANDLADRAFGP